MLIAGDHVPGMPLVEVVSRLIGSPAQIAGIAAKVGVTGWFTVTVNVVVLAHCPAAGVNVYVVVAVLLIAGDQVPGMPLVEVVSRLIGSPAQIAGIAAKVGVTGWLTVTVKVVVLAHCPTAGVKV